VSRCPETQIQNQISQVIGYTYRTTPTGQLREIPKSLKLATLRGNHLSICVAAYSTASLESQASVEVSYTGGDSNTTLLPVVNGIRGGNSPVDKQVLVSAKPPSEGSQFAGRIGDVLVLPNPSVPITTADVTITATYSASD
jgi:hypothetical protein